MVGYFGHPAAMNLNRGTINDFGGDTKNADGLCSKFEVCQ